MLMMVSAPQQPFLCTLIPVVRLVSLLLELTSKHIYHQATLAVTERIHALTQTLSCNWVKCEMTAASMVQLIEVNDVINGHIR